MPEEHRRPERGRKGLDSLKVGGAPKAKDRPGETVSKRIKGEDDGIWTPSGDGPGVAKMMVHELGGAGNAEALEPSCDEPLRDPALGSGREAGSHLGVESGRPGGGRQRIAIPTSTLVEAIKEPEWKPTGHLSEGDSLDVIEPPLLDVAEASADRGLGEACLVLPSRESLLGDREHDPSGWTEQSGACVMPVAEAENHDDGGRPRRRPQAMRRPVVTTPRLTSIQAFILVPSKAAAEKARTGIPKSATRPPTVHLARGSSS